MELSTKAENLADKVRTLPAFRNVSLLGIKAQVAEILSLIGRVEGIFSTYTIHDISHVESMLKMLDWMIPSKASQIMTPADWLLTVLSIYFHDLGMVVTTKEFDERHENPAFSNWLLSLDSSSEGREYLARIAKMSKEELDRFFFQEFIRRGHAARIREWVTGRHSRRWGDPVKSIADSVNRLLDPLPSRFRDYLGIVCESHHQDNLDKRELFPLCAPCGSEDGELVNVQYAAVLLRSADLLHVTKDRTPSIMYQALGLSDPKAVEEWDKQLGAFAVRPKGRELREDNPSSAVIVLHADFSAERPLFALQEYIAYAREQIQQSRRWITKSQEDPDAQNYSFPWISVEGDVRLEGVPPQPLRFELDRGRLLNLLVGHTIYNEPTVAVRELLQNSIDAVRYQHFFSSRKAVTEGKPAPAIGVVRILWRPSEHVLIVEDNGIGMNRDIIQENLMRVGTSYYGTAQFEAENREFTPISRFGIGILTCFMVSDDIEIITFKEDKGYRVRMTSVQADYLLRELPQGDPLLDGIEPHGTRVTLRLRGTIDFSQRSMIDIVRYWIILPECRVEFWEEGQGPEVIGFETPEEALEVYGRKIFGNLGSWDKIEYTTRSRGAMHNAAREDIRCCYELAFAVKSGMTRDRMFALARKEDLPAVCIEGIRVANALPWFEEGAERIMALLSVRGDRGLRTTVSRSDLEVDKEYARVGKICANLLFGHVQSEVEEISSRMGSPLSRASSTSQWFRSILLRHCTVEAEEYLKSLFFAFPSIVVEKTKLANEKREASRVLASPKELSYEERFWTIESRLVDSLGLMSRDLERELSLYGFLAALAPEFDQLQYSPLLPDARLFKEEIWNSHRPIRAEFSRKYKQAAIEWAPQETVVDTSINLSKLDSQMQLRERLSRFDVDMDLAFPIQKVGVGSIVGDDPKICVVSTRVGVVMQDDNEYIRAWMSLGDLFEKSAKAGDVDFIVWVVLLLNSFMNYINPSYRRRRAAEHLWKDAYVNISSQMKWPSDLPDDLGKLERDIIFNASSYWTNWAND